MIAKSLLLLPIALLVGWGVYWACRRRPVFIVRIGDGVPRASRGQVTRGFLQEIAETCARHGVRRGSIRGVADGRRINLMFSPGIPGPCRQQIRNLWGLSGWSTTSPGRPRRRP